MKSQGTDYQSFHYLEKALIIQGTPPGDRQLIHQTEAGQGMDTPIKKTRVQPRQTIPKPGDHQLWLKGDRIGENHRAPEAEIWEVYMVIDLPPKSPKLGDLFEFFPIP